MRLFQHILNHLRARSLLNNNWGKIPILCWNEQNNTKFNKNLHMLWTWTHFFGSFITQVTCFRSFFIEMHFFQQNLNQLRTRSLLNDNWDKIPILCWNEQNDVKFNENLYMLWTWTHHFGSIITQVTCFWPFLIQMRLFQHNLNYLCARSLLNNNRGKVPILWRNEQNNTKFNKNLYILWL